jgi:hypothetical protein
MAKRLACRLGRHDWTTHVEGGESYKVCAACGKSPRAPGQPGQPTDHGLSDGEPEAPTGEGSVGGGTGFVA